MKWQKEKHSLGVLIFGLSGFPLYCILESLIVKHLCNFSGIYLFFQYNDSEQCFIPLRKLVGIYQQEHLMKSSLSFIPLRKLVGIYPQIQF